MPLQIRRGTDAERSGIVFADGEIVYVTDTNELYVGDGVTTGGNIISGGSGGGATELEDLTDVSFTLPVNTGQVLKFDGSEWTNQDHIGSLEEIPDVIIQSPLTSGQVLKFNGSEWTNQDHIGSLEEIPDVIIQSPLTSGQVLAYNGLNWINADKLSSLNDDINPSLGGNLNINNFNIYGTGDLGLDGDIFLTTNNGSDFSISLEKNSDSIDPVFLNLRKGRGTTSSPTSVLLNDRLGDIGFYGYDGNNYVRSGGIQAVVSNIPSIGTVPMDLRFLVRTSTGAEIEPMRISSLGTVNFKTSIRDIASIDLQSTHNESIGSSLLIMKRSRGTIESPAVLTTNDAIYTLAFQGYTGSGWRSAATIRGVVDDTITSTAVPGRLEFITANSSGAFGIKMVLNKDGILEVDNIRGRSNLFVQFSEMPVLPTYLDESAADAYIGGSGNRVNGMMYYDTTLGKIRAVAGGIWVDLH